MMVGWRGGRLTVFLILMRDLPEAKRTCLFTQVLTQDALLNAMQCCEGHTCTVVYISVDRSSDNPTKNLWQT